MNFYLETKKEIEKHFGSSSYLTDEICTKLFEIQQIFKISFNDLFIKWESFNIYNDENELDLTIDNLNDFHNYLQNAIINQNIYAVENKNEHLILRKKKKIMNQADFKFDINKQNFNSESVKIINTDTSSGGKFLKNLNFIKKPSNVTHDHNQLTNDEKKKYSLTTKYSKIVLETLNPEITEDCGLDIDNDENKIVIKFDSDLEKYNFRTMSMKLLDSSNLLDYQINKFEHIFQNNNETSELIEFANPCLCSQFEIFCCGRIVSDSHTYENFLFTSLNANSIYLETSRITGMGQRVLLDLKKLNSYSFFSGQIVILKGKNPAGNVFIVSEILSLPDLPHKISTKQELDNYKTLMNGLAMKVLICSGPFSNQHNLDYTKFENFVKEINKSIKPHVIILSGPFIDIDNHSVKNGDLESFEKKNYVKNWDDLFRLIISNIIKKINSKIKILLIPSLKDTFTDHCSYPIGLQNKKNLDLPHNVKIITNPCNFSLNEVLIGFSGLDIFKDLKDVCKEDSKINQSPILSRFETVINHVFEQRRYYPVFPGSLTLEKSNIDSESNLDFFEKSISENLSSINVGNSSLDVPHLGLSEIKKYIPDIYINPSKLKHFVKIFKNTIVINPGSYIRPSNDPKKQNGTFAILTINPLFISNSKINVKTPVGDSNSFYNDIHKRTKVEICRS